MIDAATIEKIIAALGDQARDDIAWAEACAPPETAEAFAEEAIYVICNSGMRYAVARQIYDRVIIALRAGRSAATVFGHAGKSTAIDAIWRDRERLARGFWEQPTDEHRLCYLADLPFIGEITKYHLAKNFGADLAKPDVHLQRLAERHRCTAQELCEHLALDLFVHTGGRLKLRAATIDTLLWRACATGLLDSRTGRLREGA